LTTLLAIVGSWLAVNLLAACAADTDSYRRRVMLSALTVAVVVSCVVFVLASLFMAGGGYSGPNMVNR
jgi:uncharacterized membrane protein YeaQ/YmgE (transglycosylase-associated protein family)